MARYSLTFTKEGYAIFTSHLDMQRLFKRVFKRAGIEIAYTHGYNPHPQMSFAQPLSLGYSSVCEKLEFKTKQEYQPWFIRDVVSGALPGGMSVTDCEMMDDGVKSLASRCKAAAYEIRIPLEEGQKAPDIRSFLAQEKITVAKLNKKKRKVEIDIRPKIRKLESTKVDDKLLLKTELDAGSDSNLSPELLLKALNQFSGIGKDRSVIEITRLQLYFD